MNDSTRVFKKVADITVGKCGGANEDCCEGSQCDSSDLTCDGGTCRACGHAGQDCCTSWTDGCWHNLNDDLQCDGSTNKCNPCGNVGQDCCTGSGDPCHQGVCKSGKCKACGDTGQPCCANSACNVAGDTCKNQLCVTPCADLSVPTNIQPGIPGPGPAYVVSFAPQYAYCEVAATWDSVPGATGYEVFANFYAVSNQGVLGPIINSGTVAVSTPTVSFNNALFFGGGPCPLQVLIEYRVRATGCAQPSAWSPNLYVRLL